MIAVDFLSARGDMRTLNFTASRERYYPLQSSKNFKPQIGSLLHLSAGKLFYFKKLASTAYFNIIFPPVFRLLHLKVDCKLIRY